MLNCNKLKLLHNLKDGLNWGFQKLKRLVIVTNVCFIYKKFQDPFKKSMFVIIKLFYCNSEI